MLLGDTGTGKTSVALTLLGKVENSTMNHFPNDARKCFKVKEGANSSTKEACEKQGRLFGTEQNLTVIDNPGWSGKFDDQLKITETIVDYLQDEIQYVNTFAILFNGYDERLTRQFANTLRLIKRILEGKGRQNSLENVVLVATHWGYFPQSTNEAEKEKFLKNQKEIFKIEGLSGWENLRAVYYEPLCKLDNHDHDEEVIEELRKLVRYSTENEPFHCRDLKTAEDDISKLEKDLKAEREKNSQLTIANSKLMGHELRREKLDNCTKHLNSTLQKLDDREEASLLTMVGVGLGSAVLGVIFGFFIFRSFRQNAVDVLSLEDEENEIFDDDEDETEEDGNIKRDTAMFEKIMTPV